MKNHSGNIIKPEVDAIKIFSYTIMTIFAIMCLFPFYYIVVVSISDPQSVREGQLILWPKGFSLDAYKVTFQHARFYSSFQVSLIRTIIGTASGITLSSSLAYAVSRKYLRGRKFFTIFIVFTMLLMGVLFLHIWL